MKFHFAGKYDGDEAKLPQREYPAGYVPYKEPENAAKLSLIANGIALAVSVALVAVVLVLFIQNVNPEERAGMAKWLMFGGIFSMVLLVPHEFLHALCFKGDVYMYHYLSKGLLFVVGTEDMTKTRFILMCLCPNIVFGVVPFLLYVLFPHLPFLGMLGAIAIGSGAGDYLNVFNTLVQVPRGALVYMSGIHSYWYCPAAPQD